MNMSWLSDAYNSYSSMKQKAKKTLASTFTGKNYNKSTKSSNAPKKSFMIPPVSQWSIQQGQNQQPLFQGLTDTGGVGAVSGGGSGGVGYIGGSDGGLASIEAMLRQRRDQMIAMGEGDLRFARDNNISALNKAYSDAEAVANKDTQTVNTDFDTTKKDIENTAYNQAEATKLVAQQAGIANSQQMLGLQAGDTSRVNNMVNENTKVRDQRIADIKDRLSQIGKDRDFNIANATKEYDYELAKLKQQAEMDYQDGLNSARSSGGSGGGGGGGGSRSGSVKMKNRDASYNDAYQYYSGMLDDIRKVGIDRFEAGIRNNPAMVNDIVNQGYNFESFINGLYGAYSGGVYKSKDALMAKREAMKKQVEKQNAKAKKKK